MPRHLRRALVPRTRPRYLPRTSARKWMIRERRSGLSARAKPNRLSNVQGQPRLAGLPLWWAVGDNPQLRFCNWHSTQTHPYLDPISDLRHFFRKKRGDCGAERASYSAPPRMRHPTKTSSAGTSDRRSLEIGFAIHQVRLNNTLAASTVRVHSVQYTFPKLLIPSNTADGIKPPFRRTRSVPNNIPDTI